MRWLLAGVACAALALTAPPVAGSSSPPPAMAPVIPVGRSAGPLATLIFVHGFALGSTVDCAAFAPLHSRLGEPVLLAGVYAADTHCDRPGLPGATTGTSIGQLAHHIALLAQSVPGPVDLVGHSMGGLVVELARRLLPAGKVRHVVTLAAPYAGARLDLACPSGRPLECRQMVAGSDLSRSLPHDADLCVASTTDELVPLPSALVSGCRHDLEVVGLSHGAILIDPEVMSAVRALVTG